MTTINRLVLLLGLLVAFAFSAQASTGGFLSEDKDDRLSTIPHSAEIQKALRHSGIGSLAVQHEGWNESLESWARVQIDMMTGRASIHGQDPAYTVLSMMYERERWMNARLLPVEHPRLADIFGFKGKWVSPAEVGGSPALNELRTLLNAAEEKAEEERKLRALLNAVEQADQLGHDRPNVFVSVASDKADPAEVQRLAHNRDALAEAHARLKEMGDAARKESAFRKAANRLLDRVALSMSLEERFLVVPNAEDPQLRWLAAAAARDTDALRVESASLAPKPAAPFLAAAATLDGALARAFNTGDGSELREAVARFLGVVGASRLYPTDNYVAMKNLYVRHNPFVLAAWLYSFAAIILSLFAFLERRGLQLAGTAVLCAGFAMHTLAELLRLGITGHMPVSNMYESITFASWAAMVVALCFEWRQRKGLIALLAAIVGALALIGVAQMPLHESRFHPLRAVLNSYWLNIHVTMMLVSYGAFAIAAAVAAGYLVKSFTGREILFGRTALMSSEQMELFAYRLVQVGWPTLTVGVCLGGVWADTAWGRYWGWDPKETWALITWIVYTIYLHTRLVMGWKGRISAVACIVGFIMVLVTWLGVSYIPGFAGGLHTYASPTG